MIKNRMYIIPIALSIFFIIIGFFNAHSSYELQDYIPVPGYVTDIEEVQRHYFKGHRYEYNYDIHYYYDDDEYIVHKEGMRSRPDENTSTIYCSPDFRDVSLGDSEDAKNESAIDFSIAAALFVIGLVLFIMTDDKKKHIDIRGSRNAKIAGISGIVLSIWGLILMAVFVSGCSQITPIAMDLIIVCIVIFVISAVVFRKARK